MSKPSLESCALGGQSNKAARAFDRSFKSVLPVNEQLYTTQTLTSTGNRLVVFPENWHEINKHEETKPKPGRSYLLPKGPRKV